MPDDKKRQLAALTVNQRRDGLVFGMKIRVFLYS
jgi:hypothetical protein